ncbi:MAG: DUF4352 domain-containing protein [Saccharofermentanales bacterium]|jgi:Tfp pilus assembly major pilin PilA|nr:DUF4352 domain-containing protein [Bacillota bacterium]NLB08629.1 DUF4352 domain-containing protein [Clostridiales bacterium]
MDEDKQVKVKKKRPIWFWVLIVAVVIGVIGAIAGSGDDKDKAKTDTTKATAEATEKEAEAEQTEAPVEKDGYSVGETAEEKGVKITFLKCEESEGKELFEPDEGKIFVIAEFEVENNSDDDISISSIISVKAFVDDYAVDTDLSASVVAGDSLNGKVAPGKKLKGTLGYQLDKDWKKLEIVINPFALSKTEMKFVHEK